MPSAPSHLPKRRDQAEAAATSDKKPDGDLSADHADVPAGNNAPTAGSDGPPHCKSWKTGGPSLAAILLRFCNELPRHNVYVRLFTQMLQRYGWEGCSCKWQEEVPNADMHGASIIPNNSASFQERGRFVLTASSRHCLQGQARRALLLHGACAASRRLFTKRHVRQ
jgi:hypothetical protein